MTTISAGPERFANNPSSDLAGGINNTQTTLALDSILGFPNPGPFRVLIDNEQILITGGYGTINLTGIRGVEGTAPASHSDEAVVTNNITAFNFNSFRQEFNPIAYGAVGDGVADDSVAFQNAINDAHALTPGGHVFLANLSFKINSTLTTYANVVFRTYGAVISGAGASSVAPLIRHNLNGTTTLPGALTISSGGASITGTVTISSGNLTVPTGVTILRGFSYTWPLTGGANGTVLTSNGAGGLTWSAGGGAVASVSGTANQVTVSPIIGAVVVSLPSGGTLPGAWTSAQGMTITTGGLTVTAGGINISGGGITVTGGITGTLVTAAQPNVTSVGTLTSLGLTYNGSNTVPTLPSNQAGGKGVRIWIQTADPGSSASDGDIWLKA